MKNTILEIAYKAQIVSKNTAEQIQAIVRTNVDEKNLERVKTGAIQASHVIADIGKEAVQYKFIQDAAKGAAVGALVAVPIPLVGPMVGGIFGAAAGVIVGLKGGSSVVDHRAMRAEKDLHQELTKLDALRQQQLLTESEFQEQKRKLLRRS